MPRAKYRMKRHQVSQPSDPSYKIIPLTKGQNALVDAEDYEFLTRWNWFAHWSKCVRGYYAARDIEGKYVSMHTVIMQTGPGEEVDHIDGNGLNNRRYNLRKCFHAQNAKNKKRKPGRYLGVHWRKDVQKWAGEVMADGKRVFVGYFYSAEECAHARDEIAKQLHGPFANLNFPV
jgi:HNH endonuclease